MLANHWRQTWDMSNPSSKAGEMLCSFKMIFSPKLFASHILSGSQECLRWGKVTWSRRELSFRWSWSFSAALEIEEQNVDSGHPCTSFKVYFKLQLITFCQSAASLSPHQFECHYNYAVLSEKTGDLQVCLRKSLVFGIHHVNEVDLFILTSWLDFTKGNIPCKVSTDHVLPSPRPPTCWCSRAWPASPATPTAKISSPSSQLTSRPCEP